MRRAMRALLLRYLSFGLLTGQRAKARRRSICLRPNRRLIIIFLAILTVDVGCAYGMSARIGDFENEPARIQIAEQAISIIDTTVNYRPPHRRYLYIMQRRVYCVRFDNKTGIKYFVTCKSGGRIRNIIIQEVDAYLDKFAWSFTVVAHCDFNHIGRASGEFCHRLTPVRKIGDEAIFSETDCKNVCTFYSVVRFKLFRMTLPKRISEISYDGSKQGSKERAGVSKKTSENDEVESDYIVAGAMVYSGICIFVAYIGGR